MHKTLVYIAIKSGKAEILLILSVRNEFREQYDV